MTETGRNKKDQYLIYIITTFAVETLKYQHDIFPGFS